MIHKRCGCHKSPPSDWRGSVLTRQARHPPRWQLDARPGATIISPSRPKPATYPKRGHRRLLWTLTLNAVVDHVYRAPASPADTSVAEESCHVLSGKGLNVSRALACLGYLSTPVILCGPDTLSMYRSELLRLGAAGRLVPGLSRTRQHATVVSAADQQAFHVRECGAAARPGTLRLLQRALSDVRAGDVVALCGSSAPGLPEGAVVRLLEAAADRGAAVWIDTSGAPLRRCLELRPQAVKVNAAELEAAIGRPIGSPDAAATAVQEVLGMGVRLVCVTLGRTGLVLGTDREVAFAPAPPLEAVSAVGSGDAALAALLAGAGDSDLAVADLAALAAAAGAANALNLVPGSLDRSQFELLLARVRPSVQFR